MDSTVYVERRQKVRLWRIITGIWHTWGDGIVGTIRFLACIASLVLFWLQIHEIALITQWGSAHFFFDDWQLENLWRLLRLLLGLVYTLVLCADATILRGFVIGAKDHDGNNFEWFASWHGMGAAIYRVALYGAISTVVVCENSSDFADDSLRKLTYDECVSWSNARYVMLVLSIFMFVFSVVFKFIGDEWGQGRFALEVNYADLLRRATDAEDEVQKTCWTDIKNLRVWTELANLFFLMMLNLISLTMLSGVGSANGVAGSWTSLDRVAYHHAILLIISIVLFFYVIYLFSKSYSMDTIARNRLMYAPLRIVFVLFLVSGLLRAGSTTYFTQVLPGFRFASVLSIALVWSTGLILFIRKRWQGRKSKRLRSGPKFEWNVDNFVQFIAFYFVLSSMLFSYQSVSTMLDTTSAGSTVHWLQMDYLPSPAVANLSTTCNATAIAAQTVSTSISANPNVDNFNTLCSAYSSSAVNSMACSMLPSAVGCSSQWLTLQADTFALDRKRFSNAALKFQATADRLANYSLTAEASIPANETTAYLKVGTIAFIFMVPALVGVLTVLVAFWKRARVDESVSVGHWISGAAALFATNVLTAMLFSVCESMLTAISDHIGSKGANGIGYVDFIDGERLWFSIVSNAFCLTGLAVYITGLCIPFFNWSVLFPRKRYDALNEDIFGTPKKVKKGFFGFGGSNKKKIEAQPLQRRESMDGIEEDARAAFEPMSPIQHSFAIDDGEGDIHYDEDPLPAAQTAADVASSPPARANQIIDDTAFNTQNGYGQRFTTDDPFNEQQGETETQVTVNPFVDEGFDAENVEDPFAEQLSGSPPAPLFDIGGAETVVPVEEDTHTGRDSMGPDAEQIAPESVDVHLAESIPEPSEEELKKSVSMSPSVSDKQREKEEKEKAKKEKERAEKARKEQEKKDREEHERQRKEKERQAKEEKERAKKEKQLLGKSGSHKSVLSASSSSHLPLESKDMVSEDDRKHTDDKTPTEKEGKENAPKLSLGTMLKNRKNIVMVTKSVLKTLPHTWFHTTWVIFIFAFGLSAYALSQDWWSIKFKLMPNVIELRGGWGQLNTTIDAYDFADWYRSPACIGTNIPVSADMDVDLSDWIAFRSTLVSLQYGLSNLFNSWTVYPDLVIDRSVVGGVFFASPFISLLLITIGGLIHSCTDFLDRKKILFFAIHILSVSLLGLLVMGQFLVEVLNTVPIIAGTMINGDGVYYAAMAHGLCLAGLLALLIDELAAGEGK
eukprot:GILK01003077.1.p1 GENE.GILK01003077.1~~GILK01003077.1.p1  ORF type:complete len:1274 (+),score=296.67 GILK01003077.1:97-3822(+)